MRAFFVGLTSLALVACDGEQKDLQNELAGLTKDVRGRIEPLPTVKPYEPVPYQSFDLPDPFGPAKIQLTTKKDSGQGSGIRPDETRPREPLEAYPIETIRMVGTLQQAKANFALIRADQGLYRVRVGNYIGQNFGVITKITDNEITLRELIQDGGGEWSERTSSLLLQELEGKK